MSKFEDMIQQQECVDEIAALRRDIMAGKVADLEPVEEGELPAFFKDIHDQMIDAMEFVNEVNAKIEYMKQVLLQAMESAGMKKWLTDKMTITYVEPSTRKVFDSKRFKQAYPDIFDSFTKESETKSSVRITLNKKQNEQLFN